MTRTRTLDPIITTLIEDRENKGWSKRLASRVIGVSSATVCAWESGKNDPTLTNLQSWASMFGYEVTLTPIGDKTCV